MHYISKSIIKYHSVYLNQNNITKDKRVIYAPNHRPILDLLIMLAGLSNSVHWAALKRFFEGKDGFLIIVKILFFAD